MIKSIYSIQQVADLSNTSSHTLRYYERIGLIFDVNRASSGHRRYSDSDLEWISFLKQLKRTGMPLEQIKKFAELRRQGDVTARQRRKMLEVQREATKQQIQTLTDCLKMIDYKINRHRKKEQSL